jgi:hypothetical protein
MCEKHTNLEIAPLHRYSRLDADLLVDGGPAYARFRSDRSSLIGVIQQWKRHVATIQIFWSATPVLTPASTLRPSPVCSSPNLILFVHILSRYIIHPYDHLTD